MKKTLFFIIVLFHFCLVMPAGFVYAQSSPPQDSTGPLKKLQDIQPNTSYQGGDDATLANVVGTVINAFLSLLGVIFVGLMIYAGFMWMTARGDEAKVEKAKDTLTRAIVGIVITLASFAIWNFVYQYFISK